MSLMGSLDSGVSAMQSFVKGMEVIGDNIANSKTVGFKKQRVSYSDSFSNTLRDAAPGGDNISNQTPLQVGSGVNVSSTQKIFNQGSIELTGVATDLAVSGSGFFRVLDESGEERLEFLTRDGSFRVDAEGYMVDKNGYYLLGLANGSAGETPIQNGTIGKIQIRIPDDQRIKTDANGNPVDGANRIVLSDGTRAAINEEGIYFRVDAGGRILDTPAFDVPTVVLNNLGNTSARAVLHNDGNFYMINAAGNYIDANGAELAGPVPYDPNAPDPGALWDPATQIPASKRATFVLEDIGLSSARAVLHTDGNFYLTNSTGNYIDATGSEVTDGSGNPIRANLSDPAPGAVAWTPLTQSTVWEPRFRDTEAIVLNDINGVAARAVLHDDGEYYLVNAAGNYINSSGEEVGTAAIPFDTSSTSSQAVRWNPAVQRTISPSDPSVLSYAALGTNPTTFSSVRVAEPNVTDPNQFLLTINSWSFNKNGELIVTLNDGSSYTRATVLLQQVQDPDALVDQGNGLFSGYQNAGVIGGLETWNGQRYTGTQLLPNQSSNGAIISRALEGSNTDLTREFADMITTQRAFQAGSRVISVSDEMLQEIINLKR